MKQKIVYEAKDGREFNTVAECVEHENLLQLLSTILAPLGTQTLADNEYVQCDQQALFLAKRELVKLVIARYSGGFPEWKSIDPNKVSLRGGMGRVVCDNDSAIASTWMKLACCDFDSGRRYSQPFYVLNPSAAVEKK